MDQIVIIGAGLAGLTAAIHLSKAGHKIVVIEKNSFPHHKVCGEYVSNEVLPYLNWLGIDPLSLGATQISTMEFSSSSGAMIKARLPLGGFGISRFTLDNHMYELALAAGCRFIFDTVTDVRFDGNLFSVALPDSQIPTALVIGAFGKRSNIDQKLSRKFIMKKSPWLAVKSHYTGSFAEDVVGLHNFSGGYCGVSKVENGLINICYLANYESFKKYKNIETYQQMILIENPHLKQIFKKCSTAMQPLTISQISFATKLPVENNILMVGDTAGLIHPLCGNGMAMAIHSAKIASELVLRFFDGEMSRQDLEERYSLAWNRQFKARIKMGRLLSGILRKRQLSEILIRIVVRFPAVLNYIIRRTHGQPIPAPL